MLLTLESHRDLAHATPEQVARALSLLASPTGPTYIILESRGSYCQAAGTDGRYVLETRDIFGEGFTHFRACVGQPGSGEPTTVFHRKRCSKHPPRKCPLEVLSSEVVGFDHVRQALLAFAACAHTTTTLEALASLVRWIFSIGNGGVAWDVA